MGPAAECEISVVDECELELDESPSLAAVFASFVDALSAALTADGAESPTRRPSLGTPSSRRPSRDSRGSGSPRAEPPPPPPPPPLPRGDSS